MNRKRIPSFAFIGLVIVLLIVAACKTGSFDATIWSLFPPFVAIGLALITKEVYSSLFIGIICGGLLYSDFSFEGTLLHIFEDGMVASLADSYNVGILIFLVILGIIVAMMNKAGGSAAFGKWASSHIKTKVGAQLATIALGVLIFIDDYFNCLTVGSVMRPVADKHNISREKLAYLIDATAAPVCIIAPVSSWAAAVASSVTDPNINGFQVFIKAIPYNYYAILTIAMMIFLSFMKFDFGPMAKFERVSEKAVLDDLIDNFSEQVNAKEAVIQERKNPEGKVIDLVFPIVVLIIACVVGMIYSGGFFEGVSFVDSFSASDASVGLMLGSAVTLVIIIVYYIIRKTMTFSELMACTAEGFKAMVPAILILSFAWTLKAMTNSLGSSAFVENVVGQSAEGFKLFLPAIVFIIGCIISFATGTSWGTFGILIPITLPLFPIDNPLGVVCVSACMAGAVCGDHCSPISDTTIMASAGAQCEHINHVRTQLPYAITVAVVSFISYIITGFVPNAWITLPVAIVLMIAALLVIRKVSPVKVDD